MSLPQSPDDAIAAVASTFVDRMNESFDDSLLLVGRILGGHRDATRARAVGVDRSGIDLTLADRAGDHRVRVRFAQPVGDEAQLAAAAFALVARARQESGEAGTTSGERAVAEMSRIRTFLTEVVTVTDVHPHLRQITFGGDDLTGFSPLGPDTFLYVLLPPPGRTELTIDQGFTWAQQRQMPDDERPVGAYYTVRRWRPERHEVDLLFVLHDEAGPASSWAARARPGDPAALWGPRTAYDPPPDTDRYVLVADETGLPAAASILESLPAGTPAQVFAEVADQTEHLPLPASPSFDITWLHRDGTQPGASTLLADAVRAACWPAGCPYVWGGGESRAMTAVRRYVRDERGLPRAAVSLTAYWRHAATTDDDAS